MLNVYAVVYVFANIFLAKTLKQLIHQSFTPPEFCAILYVLYIYTYMHKTKHTHNANRVIINCFVITGT